MTKKSKSLSPANTSIPMTILMILKAIIMFSNKSIQPKAAKKIARRTKILPLRSIIRREKIDAGRRLIIWSIRLPVKFSPISQ